LNDGSVPAVVRGRRSRQPISRTPQPPTSLTVAGDGVLSLLIHTTPSSGLSFDDPQLRGFEVDDAARDYIRSRGFEQYFTHRTGHSIGQDVHGNGANMDNLETHDERKIVPWTCFSIEPGIYLNDFGVRSEVNVFAGEKEARVTGEIQNELVII